MKTKTFIELINFHYAKDKNRFNSTLKKISNEFKSEGNEEISFKINDILNSNLSIKKNNYVTKENNLELVLPTKLEIEKNLIVERATKMPNSPLKILFYGDPGTGKTEVAKSIANKIKKELFLVNFNDIISSYLGETSKNLSLYFEEFDFDNSIIFLDEIDGMISNRDTVKSEEIYRATIQFMKLLDEIKDSAILIAATNIQQSIDKAILRRFNIIVNFNEYQEEDLLKIFDYYFDFFGIDFKKKLVLNFIKMNNEVKTPDSIKKSLEKISVSIKLGIFEKLIETSQPAELDKIQYMKKLYEYGFNNEDLSKIFNVSTKTISRWRNG